MVIYLAAARASPLPQLRGMEALLSGKTQPAEDLCAEDPLVQFPVV